MIRSTRPAISLLELLVVLAVVGGLVGLILPAVQKARESANRTRCQNHLRQTALAVHGYHDAHKHYPPGGKNGADDPPSDPALAYAPANRAEWSWPWFVLPHLGEDPVFQLPDTPDGNAEVGRAVVRVFVCPSRRAARLYEGENQEENGVKAVRPPHAVIDYAMNAGSVGYWLIPTDLVEAYTGITVRTGMGTVRADDVKDGLSNTLLLGEKRLPRPRFGSESGDDEPAYSPGWGDWDVVRYSRIYRPDKEDKSTWVYVGPVPDPLSSPEFPDDDRYRFGSSHPIGMNAALCDGSVRVIRYSDNSIAFGRLCTRSMGTTFDPDDL